MNCVNHPESPVVAYCRSCGKGLCAECRRDVQGTIYCEEHALAAAAVPPPPPPVAGPVPPAPPLPGSVPHGVPYTAGQTGVSPGVAFFAGLIPGVGAIYNGQYAKGLIHAVVFGLLISIVNSHGSHTMTPLFGILIALCFPYMAFEAYHTAKKRRDGIPVDEFSSLVPMQAGTGKFPMGPVVLIGLGVLLLMDELDVLPFERLVRYWPVLLILLGVYMLYGRLEGRAGRNVEAGHERR
jgi:hypothetical protein